MKTEHYTIGLNKLAEIDCDQSVKNNSPNSANLLIVRTLSCILGIFIFFQTSFSQNFHEAYNGRDITPATFKTLPCIDRVWLLSTIYKNAEETDMFLKSSSVNEIDSMITSVISLVEQMKGSPDWILVRFKTVVQILEKDRSSKLKKENNVSSTSGSTSKVDNLENQFIQRKLEDKMSSLAFMVNLDALFNKFYSLLTSSEKDSAIVATDNLIYQTQWLGEKLKHSQKDIDKELKYYSDLKNKLMKIQAKK